MQNTTAGDISHPVQAGAIQGEVNIHVLNNAEAQERAVAELVSACGTS